MDGSKLIMLVNTMEIREGRLAEFRESVERAVRFTEEHGPQLIVNVYIDEDNMRAQSVQLYPDSDAILTHWELSDPYISPYQGGQREHHGQAAAVLRTARRAGHERRDADLARGRRADGDAAPDGLRPLHRGRAERGIEPAASR